MLIPSLLFLASLWKGKRMLRSQLPDQITLAHHTGFFCTQKPSADAEDVHVADSPAARGALDDARDHADSSIAPRAGDDAPAAPSPQKS